MSIMIPKTKDGLGNDMFIYAFAYNLSRKYNEPIEVYDSKGDYLLDGFCDIDNPMEKIRNREFSFLQRVLLKRYQLAEARYDYMELYSFEKKNKRLYASNGLYVCENGYIDFDIFNYSKAKYVLGYFQSARYFANYKDDIIKLFNKTKPLSREAEGQYFEIKNNPKAVALCVRRGDYVGNKLHDVCTPRFFYNAIEMMQNKIESPTFYVFSNDISYCRGMFNKIDAPIKYESGQNRDYETIKIISACSHFIISNSSFHWWGQYLNNSKKKIVIAPRNWFGISCPCDIYEDYWERIDV